MPRKLKVYQTSQGFFDLAVAAPSMKAALQAWGANMNLFHQGMAKESADSDVIAAAMGQPGIVLRRPVGSNKSFSEDADLPTVASLSLPRSSGKARPKKAKSERAPRIDKETERRAAASFEREEEKRQRQRKREEAAAAKARKKRSAAVAKAEAALDEAKGRHEKKAVELEADLTAARRRAQAEEDRWLSMKARLEAKLRKVERH